MDERRLRDDLASLEEAAPPSALPALPARRRSSLLWVPAGLALAGGIFIGLLGAQYLDGQRLVGDASPSASAPIAGSPSPSPASALAWSQGTFPSTAIMRSLSVVDGRVFATGYGPEAWYSDDGGASWSRSALKLDDIGGASIATTQDLSLGPVVSFGGRLVSLGTRMAGTSGNDADVAGSIWFSEDRGATWTLSSGETPPVSAGIATDGRCLVAVGRPWHAGSSEIWTSSDGTAWNKVDAPELVGVAIANIASTDGSYMAVGTRENAFHDSPGAVTSTSKDGTHWETTVLAAPGRLSDITIQRSGFAMSGDLGSGDGNFGAALMTSQSDGMRISQVSRQVGSISGPIAAGPLGVVIGTQNIGNRFGAQLWFLPGGATGAAVASDVSFVPGDVVALPDRFVALVSCPPTALCTGPFQILIGTPHGQPASATSPPLLPSTYALPTLESDNGWCRGVGLDAMLAGDPTDPHVAWLIDANGRRREVVWPPGLTARFDPELQVVDRSGAIVLRAGAHIDSGCTAGPSDDPGSLLLIRPGS
jgi:photosystem II stability/assembly factor-like uncharacterized protein